MSDEEIIAEVRKGNHSAFRELIDRYESRVAATVIGMLGPGAEAEDVGQETFIRLYRSIDQFRGESSLATYLTRIAINLSLNAIKRRRRFHRLFFLPDERTLQSYEDEETPEYGDERVFVHKALQKMEPKFRSVIVLRLLDGYSTAETARILQIPQGTVLSRLARAQQKLKNILTPYWEVNHG